VRVKLKIGREEWDHYIACSEDCWRMGAWIIDALRKKGKVTIKAELFD